MAAQRVAEAERDQDARRVGRELDAGAGLLQALGLLVDRNPKPGCAIASAAVSPPMPAPATMTVREEGHGVTLRGRGLRRRPLPAARTPAGVRRAGSRRRIVAEQRRAIRTDDLVGVAHVEKDMGVVERRQRPDAHELVRADLDDRHAGRVVEMGNDPVRHVRSALRNLAPAEAADAAHMRGGTIAAEVLDF